MTKQPFPRNFKIHEQTLENGSLHIHIENQEASHFFIGIYVKAGSRFEHKNESGISHFLEHMMFRGSSKNPSFLDLAKKFEAFGGEWNAATGHEHTEYTYLGLAESSIPLTKLFGELLETPLLLDPDKEKEIILREIEDEMNEFDEFIDLDFHAASMLWKQDGFQSPITGKKKTVKKLGPKHLKNYHEKHYTADNIVVCTWGGTNSKEIQKAVKDSFRFPKEKKKENLLEEKASDEVTASSFPLFRFVKNTDNQYQVQLAFKSEGEWSPKTSLHTLICHILANGFSSRLSKSLREEKGLVYSISSYLSSFVDRGLLCITYACTESHFFEALTELLSSLKDLKENGLDEEEVSRAKKQETLELMTLLHDPEAHSFYLARHKHWNKALDIEASLKEIKSITKETLEKEIEALFQASKALLIIMGGEKLKWERQCKKLMKDYLT